MNFVRHLPSPEELPATNLRSVMRGRTRRANHVSVIPKMVQFACRGFRDFAESHRQPHMPRTGHLGLCFPNHHANQGVGASARMRALA